MKATIARALRFMSVKPAALAETRPVAVSDAR
jgi:hypothetical protein